LKSKEAVTLRPRPSFFPKFLKKKTKSEPIWHTSILIVVKPLLERRNNGADLKVVQRIINAKKTIKFWWSGDQL